MIILHILRRHNKSVWKQLDRSGSLLINKATKEYNIPRGTIQNKLKEIHSKSVARPTVFYKTSGRIVCIKGDNNVQQGLSS